MSAVIESAGAGGTGAHSTKRIRFGSVEPAILAILKQLDPRWWS